MSLSPLCWLLMSALTAFALSAQAAKTITVGHRQADVIGTDSLALQQAVDRVAQAGGGTVTVRPGTYTMYDSLKLASHVTVRGEDPAPVLLKCDGVEHTLLEDSGYAVDTALLDSTEGLRVGMGVQFEDQTHRSGWYTNLRTITRIEGQRIWVDEELDLDYIVTRGAKITNAFPLIAGERVEDAHVINLVADGNQAKNSPLNGCRGGAIYLWKSPRCTIERCVARDFDGDGISFQVSPHTTVTDCEADGNAQLGIHPGSGSDHVAVRNCRIHDNGSIGLFLCWRVKHSEFTDNVITANGGDGISIGHKDTDNLFLRNTVQGNGRHGVHFRPETEANGGHRNTFRENVIRDNGAQGPGSGFQVDGLTHHLTLEGNTVTDTRPAGQKTQLWGFFAAPDTDYLVLRGNKLEGNREGAVKSDSKGEHNELQ